MIEDFDKYFEHIRAFAKDNDERGLFDKSPCSFCEDFTREDIDNPPFNEEDWAEFWRKAKANYPLHSVYGGAAAKDDATITGSEAGRVQKHLGKMKVKGKRVLEIGYGFGGAGVELIKNGADYVGIDYVSSNPLLPKDVFLEIKESGIPKRLIKRHDFDIIYSYNVFQHLTQKQRFDYIRQSFEALKKGGVLVFSVFERVPGHGLRDTYSATFFNVHTKVDEPEELQDFLRSVGFKFKRVMEGNVCEETVNVLYTCKKY